MIFITGVAGFIGSKVAEKILESGEKVVGIDNLNSYYSPKLKMYRIEMIKRRFKDFIFIKGDIENMKFLDKIFRDFKFSAIINEAARAGVRQSLKNPIIYERTNSLGNLNLLEMARKYGVRKFILASTSSVYAGKPIPFKEDMVVDNPISPYAATKRAAEIMSYTYHKLFNIDVVILRYFTVYGPMGRPDMSIFKFTKNILEGKEVEIYGNGKQKRDFTYVDDVAEATQKSLQISGYEIINVGNNDPKEIIYIIKLIEEFSKKKAKIKYLPENPLDIKETWANIEKAKSLIGWTPKTKIEKGIENVVRWTIENQELISKIPTV